MERTTLHADQVHGMIGASEPIVSQMITDPAPAYSHSAPAYTQPPPTAADGDRPTDPPAYNVAVELPSYEEFERTKKEEEEENALRSAAAAAPAAAAQHILPVNILLTGVTSHDDSEAAAVQGRDLRNVDRLVIGTDGMFVLGFVFAFLFNWLGLLIAFCLMHTCAGRFGALAGFGMSIIKWVAIARRNNWAHSGSSSGAGMDDSWMWWMMIAFGMLISCSGFLQYIRVKFLWMRRHGNNETTFSTNGGWSSP